MQHSYHVLNQFSVSICVCEMLWDDDLGSEILIVIQMLVTSQSVAQPLICTCRQCWHDGHVRCYQCRKLYEFPLTLSFELSICCCAGLAVRHAARYGASPATGLRSLRGSIRGTEPNSPASTGASGAGANAEAGAADASGIMNPGQLQGVMYMLNKQGAHQHKYACCCNISCKFA